MIYDIKHECMTRSEMKELQSERLIKLVERVYNTVPVYKKKMDSINLKPTDIKSVDDLYKLPFTVKQDLRDNYPYGMFSAPMEDIVRLHASSGTTGKLTVVGYTQNDIDLWTECMARSLAMAGTTKKSIVHVAYGYGLFTGGLGAHYGAEKIGAAVVPASSGNTKRQLTLMKDFGADILCCTPSYAIYLATEMEKEGIKLSDLKIKAGVFGAEPWSNNMRDEIEKTLKISAFDIYGLSEISGPGVAMECCEKCGSHIQEDHFIPEIINRDTLMPVPYGEEGELVFTTITKTGQPLIRYRTKDITSLIPEPCKCGRTTVRMNKVLGRTDDMLIIRGVNVFPSQIETAIMNISGSSPHYMIYVDRIDNLDVMEIHIEMSDKLYSDTVSKIENVKKAIESEVHSYLGIGAKVRLVEPNTIPRSEGKAKRVVDNRKI
jgi:phenylacetate-CoA ligase